MKKPDSLHVVLALRTRHRESAERALANALSDMHAAQQLLKALQNDLERLKTLPPAAQGELLHIVELLHRAELIAALERNCEEGSVVLNEHKAIVAKQQQAYLDAKRSCEAVDTLLKARAAQARDHQNRQDAKRADDLYLGRLVRNGHTA